MTLKARRMACPGFQVVKLQTSQGEAAPLGDHCQCPSCESPPWSCVGWRASVVKSAKKNCSFLKSPSRVVFWWALGLSHPHWHSERRFLLRNGNMWEPNSHKTHKAFKTQKCTLRNARFCHGALQESMQHLKVKSHVRAKQKKKHSKNKDPGSTRVLRTQQPQEPNNNQPREHTTTALQSPGLLEAVSLCESMGGSPSHATLNCC